MVKLGYIDRILLNHGLINLKKTLTCMLKDIFMKNAWLEFKGLEKVKSNPLFMEKGSH